MRFGPKAQLSTSWGLNQDYSNSERPKRPNSIHQAIRLSLVLLDTTINISNRIEVVMGSFIINTKCTIFK